MSHKWNYNISCYNFVAAHTRYCDESVSTLVDFLPKILKSNNGRIEKEVSRKSKLEQWDLSSPSPSYLGHDIKTISSSFVMFCFPPFFRHSPCLCALFPCESVGHCQSEGYFFLLLHPTINQLLASKKLSYLLRNSFSHKGSSYKHTHTTTAVSFKMWFSGKKEEGDNREGKDKKISHEDIRKRNSPYLLPLNNISGEWNWENVVSMSHHTKK